MVAGQQHSQYQAHAFHESFKQGKASGELLVTSSQLVFHHPQQHQAFPLSGIEISMGGASDRLVFIKHPLYPDWSLYTADRSILKNPQLYSDKPLSAQLRRSKRVRMMNWSVLTAVIAAMVLIPVLLFAYMDEMTSVAAQQIPAEWEQSLGKTAFEQYSLQMELLDSPEASAPLQALVEPLLAAVPKPHPEFKIYLVNDPALNAFALPGGYIVLNSGLVLAAQSGEEVLGVLAHEIAHVTEQHGIRNLISTAGTYLIVQTVLGDASGLFATIASAAPMLIGQQYSRNFESQADEQGFMLLEAAKINPEGLVRFFKILQADKAKKLQRLEEQTQAEKAQASSGTVNADQQDAQSQEAEPTGLTQQAVRKELERWLSSHPTTDARISALSELIEQAPSQHYIDVAEAFSELQNTLGKLVAMQEAKNESGT